MRVIDEWKELDTFIEPGRDFTKGKFGFLFQSNGELTNFRFQASAEAIGVRALLAPN